MSKYSEALENRKRVKFIKWKTYDADGSLHFEDVVPVSDVDVIEQALRIANRLERGDVGFSSLAECSKKYNVKMDDANEFFKAMAAQLIKEEENK